jgi:hypothetical protein
MPAGLERIELLRKRRGPRGPAPDFSISKIVGIAQAEAQRYHRRLGALMDLWQELVPPDLAQHTKLTNFRGSVLNVTVDSASISYELDRLLRDGLLAQLRQRHRGTLFRVRLSVGAIEKSGTTDGHG